MEYLFIYALQMTDFITLLIGGSLILAIMTGVALVTLLLEENECFDKVKKGVKTIFITCIVVFLLGEILPNKQTLILWGGTFYGKKAVNQVVNSDKYKKISELIDLKLDSLIQAEKSK